MTSSARRRAVVAVAALAALVTACVPPTSTGPRTDVYELPRVHGYQSNPWMSAVADFDEDGFDDIAISVYDPGVITVMINNGAGSFQIRTHLDAPGVPDDGSWPYDSWPNGPGPLGLAAGDMNGDGHVDLVALNPSIRRATFAAGDGHGNFQVGPQWVLPTNSRTVELADVNGDDKLDALFASRQGVLVWHGDGHGGGAPAEYLLEPNGPSVDCEAATGDFTSDGLDDVAANCSGEIHVFAQDTSGNLGEVFSVDPLDYYAIGLKVADMNRDGRLDLVSGSSDVLLGLGGGQFALPVRNDGTEAQIKITAYGDLDRDGCPDAVGLVGFIDGPDGGIIRQFGACNGSLVAQPKTEIGLGPTSVALGNFDRKGGPDIVVTYAGEYDLGTPNAGVGSVRVRLSGDGTA